MKKRLQMQLYPDRSLKLLCTGLLLLGLTSGVSYAAKPAELALAAKEAARINITGTISDSKGEPLPGVSIKIKGSTSGTSTDINGVFRLNLPTGNETLVITYIGFKTQEVAVNGRTTLNIKLMEDAQSLDEVVVVGYGVQKRAHLTGAVETIKAEEIEDLPVSNVGAAIAGRVLGVGISGGTTRPGAGSTIEIRNASALAKDAGTSSPLYVIDGIVQVTSQGAVDNSAFNNLAPSEIESISFLKDAAAAIYGSRAANGVVLVTTKRGKEGKPRISYNGSYGVNDEAYRPKMMNAYQFGMYMNIMNGKYGQGQDATANTIFTDDELEHFKTINYDWLDPAWSSAYTMQHSLNASGGTERATYFANIGYYEQDGNLGTLDYSRWNFRAGSDVKVATNLKVGLQLSGNYGNTVKTFNKISGENDNNDYKTLLQTPRYIPMYVDGYPVRLPGTNNDLSRYHFYELQRLGNISDAVEKAMTVNAFAEYDMPFLKGMKARVSYGRNMSNSIAHRVGTQYQLYEFDRLGTHKHIYDGAAMKSPVTISNDNRISFINQNAESYQANFSLNYSRQFGLHSVSGLFTVEKAEAESSQQNVMKDNPSLSNNGQFNTAFGAIDGSSAAYESGNLSYIGRANWSYADKYLAEFLFRSDASTKFAPENYWGKFYSGSLGWVISEEDFFDIPAIDFLKIRYAVGLLGNDQTQAWAWRQRYTFQTGKGLVLNGNSDASVGMKMEKSPNRQASWSDEWKNNLGIDARFLNGKLSSTIEGFYNKGTNMLLERTGSVPITVGGSVAPENFGAVNTYGIELSLGWNDKISSDFNYGVDVRFAWYDNKVVTGNFNDQDILLPWNKRPGESDDNGVWGYDYLGMFKSEAEIKAYKEKYKITQVFGESVDELRPGMLYYRDIRGPLQADGTFKPADGVIDQYDQIKLANKKSNPYGFGMTLKASYKSLSFNAVISGSFGGWAEYDGSARNKLNNDISRVFENRPAFWGDIYDPELNPNGRYPNPHWSAISLSPTSEFWRVSSFRMRMRNINIGYSLPKQLAERLKVNNARIYLTAVNPFNFYNPYSYRDPDIAYDSYPNLRTVSLGVNLSL